MFCLLHTIEDPLFISGPSIHLVCPPCSPCGVASRAFPCSSHHKGTWPSSQQASRSRKRMRKWFDTVKTECILGRNITGSHPHSSLPPHCQTPHSNLAPRI